VSTNFEDTGSQQVEQEVKRFRLVVRKSGRVLSLTLNERLSQEFDPDGDDGVRR